MSELTVHASLASLPTELYVFIIPDPVALHPALSSLDASTFEWMPIKLDSSQGQMSAPERETLMTLRALSQTSKLHEVFKAQPHLAAHVKHFTFSWWSEEGLNDMHACSSLGEEHGSVLDMAFVDRGALCDRRRAECGDAQLFTTPLMSYFLHDFDIHVQPGTFRKADETAINPNRSGPDGVGEDPRIKSPSDFTEALTAIVEKFSALKGFNWQCEATPMLVGVFNALQKAKQLSRLHTAFWFPRKFKHLPIWRLARKLEHLSIGTFGEAEMFDSDFNYYDDFRFITPMELDEVELPSSPCEGEEDALVEPALYTVLNAASGGQYSTTGGRLTRLVLPATWRTALWKVFAVPSLMADWVCINDWGMYEADLREWEETREPDPDSGEGDSEEAYQARGWLLAAIMLRRALFHCSRPSLAQQPGSTSSRLLTSNDVKAMRSEFQRNGLPRVSKLTLISASLKMLELSLIPGSPIDRYFGWLIEEDGLAQQVADAWNTVVERGDADLLTCYCTTCYTPEASV